LINTNGKSVKLDKNEIILCGLTVQLFGNDSATLVQGDFPVFVGNRDVGPIVDQIFCNARVCPEAGIMQRCVAMFVDKIDVSFVLQQLQNEMKSLFDEAIIFAV
jgi:hypothetical protein